MNRLERESKELMKTIKEKNIQLSVLRNTNIEYARSLEVLKTQMFRSIPEVTKSKAVKGLRDIDQKYQHYKKSQEKESVLKECAMTLWDRFYERFGFTLSSRHSARKAEVKEYFQLKDAHVQLLAGLQTGSDANIASSLNKLNISQRYLDLWKSRCETKNQLSENSAAVKKLTAEINEFQEKLKKSQDEQKQLGYEEAYLHEDAESYSKTSEPTTILGFSLE